MERLTSGLCIRPRDSESPSGSCLTGSADALKADALNLSGFSAKRFITTSLIIRPGKSLSLTYSVRQPVSAHRLPWEHLPNPRPLTPLRVSPTKPPAIANLHHGISDSNTERTHMIRPGLGSGYDVNRALVIFAWSVIPYYCIPIPSSKVTERNRHRLLLPITVAPLSPTRSHMAAHPEPSRWVTTFVRTPLRLLLRNFFLPKRVGPPQSLLRDRGVLKDTSRSCG
jgi:hypothetical protein